MSLPPCQSSDAELFSCAFFRFGIGRFTTEEEVDYTAEKCIHHVKRLREMRSALLYQRPSNLAYCGPQSEGQAHTEVPPTHCPFCAQ